MCEMTQIVYYCIDCNARSRQEYIVEVKLAITKTLSAMVLVMHLVRKSVTRLKILLQLVINKYISKHAIGKAKHRFYRL